MNNNFFTPSQDWQVHFSKLEAAGIGFGGALLRLWLSSPETNFRGEISIHGSGPGSGVGLVSDLSQDWVSLDVMNPFSPNDLHGARGTVVVPLAVGSYMAGRVILLSAKRAYRKHFFHNAILGSDGLPSVGWGGFVGAFTGQWKIEAVWSEATWW